MKIFAGREARVSSLPQFTLGDSLSAIPQHPSVACLSAQHKQKPLELDGVDARSMQQLAAEAFSSHPMRTRLLLVFAHLGVVLILAFYTNPDSRPFALPGNVLLLSTFLGSKVAGYFDACPRYWSKLFLIPHAFIPTYIIQDSKRQDRNTTNARRWAAGQRRVIGTSGPVRHLLRREIRG